MRTILVTGATGSWGRAALRAFRAAGDVRVRALVQGTRADRAVLRAFAGWPLLEVVPGDLTRYEDVQRAVRGVDVVLNLGAVVSPLADVHPDLAWRVNVGGVRNLIAAVRSLPDPGAVGVIGVGTVAQTGHREPPHHWGRVGDPQRVSVHDEYAASKVVGERLLVESGLPRWAWLRVSGVVTTAALGIRDPIVTHTPLHGVMEWVSVADCARLAVALAREDVPDAFWGDVYNVGGGESCRVTNWDAYVAFTRALGGPDVRQWFERNWFATRNFHGQWFSDSDRLEALVPFRSQSFAEAVADAAAAAPAVLRSGGRVPAWLVKHAVLGPLARRPRGTIRAVRARDADEVAVHFGSMDAWRRLGDWSTFEPPAPSRTPALLDHGYDETKPPEAWDARDLAEAARFRGGTLESRDVEPGEPGRPLAWRCAHGHSFAASPKAVLSFGHWCPDCVRDTASYAGQARLSPFLAQVVTD